MVYNQQLVFTPNGPYAQNASVRIINDMIALEENETISVRLVFLSTTSGVSLGHFPTTVVEIVDNDCKLTHARSHIQGYLVCFVTMQTQTIT